MLVGYLANRQQYNKARGKLVLPPPTRRFLPKGLTNQQSKRYNMVATAVVGLAWGSAVADQ